MKTPSTTVLGRLATLTIALLLPACTNVLPSAQESTAPSPSSSINTITSSPSSSPSPSPIGDPFARGLDKAASATNLTQTAQTQEDWNLVIAQWQNAIALMKAVPAASSNHATAQKLVTTYQQKLAQAQQQAKRGGPNRVAIATKNDSEGGIPLLAGGTPGTGSGGGEALGNVNALLRQQADFFAKQKRFAANLVELGSSVPPDTPNYAYSTGVVQAKIGSVTAAAKQDGLASYMGAIFAITGDNNAETTTTIVCATAKPTKAPPPLPRLINGEARCPTGSVKVQG